MEVAGFAFDHLLLWDPTNLPVVPLRPLFSCVIKAVSTAVFLVTVDLRIFFATVQAGHNLCRFSGI
jgi:hypothetical protein